jgi:hypothetical protein
MTPWYFFKQPEHALPLLLVKVFLFFPTQDVGQLPILVFIAGRY